MDETTPQRNEKFREVVCKQNLHNLTSDEIIIKEFSVGENVWNWVLFDTTVGTVFWHSFIECSLTVFAKIKYSHILWLTVIF